MKKARQIIGLKNMFKYFNQVKLIEMDILTGNT